VLGDGFVVFRDRLVQIRLLVLRDGDADAREDVDDVLHACISSCP